MYALIAALWTLPSGARVPMVQKPCAMPVDVGQQTMNSAAYVNSLEVRWAKKEKKRQGPSGGTPGSGMINTPSMPMHTSTGSS
jgi:hypothetical protein